MYFVYIITDTFVLCKILNDVNVSSKKAYEKSLVISLKFEERERERKKVRKSSRLSHGTRAERESEKLIDRMVDRIREGDIKREKSKKDNITS